MELSKIPGWIAFHAGSSSGSWGKGKAHMWAATGLGGLWERGSVLQFQCSPIPCLDNGMLYMVPP